MKADLAMYHQVLAWCFWVVHECSFHDMDKKWNSVDVQIRLVFPGPIIYAAGINEGKESYSSSID